MPKIVWPLKNANQTTTRIFLNHGQTTFDIESCLVMAKNLGLVSNPSYNLGFLKPTPNNFQYWKLFNKWEKVGEKIKLKFKFKMAMAKKLLMSRVA